MTKIEIFLEKIIVSSYHNKKICVYCVKKVFYIVYFLVITLGISFLLKNDGQVVVYFDNYEVIANKKIVIFLLLLVFLAGYYLSSIVYTLSGVNKRRLLKKTDNMEIRYKKYLDGLYEAYISSFSNDFKTSYKKIKKASKYVRNNFTDLMKSHILFKEQKYEQLIGIIRSLNLNKNNDLIEYNIQLTQAIENNNRNEIKILANKILELQKNNINCLNILFNIYKQEQNWEQCLILIEKIRKFLPKKQYNDEMFSINKELAVYYFNKSNYDKSLRHSLMVFDKNKNIYENNKILIFSLQNTGSRKVNRFIEKIWKYTARDEFGNIYLGTNTNKKTLLRKAKTLYNLNKNDVYSVLFYSNILIKNDSIKLIDENMKNILDKYKYKETFEILLRIEEKEKTDSFLISNLREKIKSSQSIF
jgi:hypothetical protein